MKRCVINYNTALHLPLTEKISRKLLRAINFSMVQSGRPSNSVA